MPNHDKSYHATFISFLEKHDPTGLSQAYYKTLAGKYEKTVANEGITVADRQALSYIKQNDPTGFIRWYYEESKMGQFERQGVKSVDQAIDSTINAAGKVFDKGIEGIKHLIQEAAGLVDKNHPIEPKKNGHHYSKPLPTHPIETPKSDKKPFIV